MQIVHSTRRGSRDIEHLGSAHDEAELEALKTAAQQRLAQGQAELDLGLDVTVGSGPLEIVSSRMAHLWEALRRVRHVRLHCCHRWRRAVPGPGARADHRTEQQVDALRVVAETGIAAASYATLKGRLPS